MSGSTNKSPEFLLGEIHADVKWVKEALMSHKKVDDDHETRLTSLEQSRFKANFIVATVAATVGFVFSNLKDGIEWLTKLMGHNS